MTRIHLHREDCPKALAILGSVLRHRLPGGTALGFEQTENGAWVDWSRLTRSSLSTTEIGVVHVAQGVAILERHGGALPGHLQAPVSAAFDVPERRTSRRRIAEIQNSLRAVRPREDHGDDTGREASQ